MNVGQWLATAQKTLQSSKIGTARLDALLLLEDTIKVNRANILADPDYELSTAQYSKLTKLLKRRSQHEPMAYIRGSVEFYGHNFLINDSVLVPRPESETIIELLKDIIQSHSRPSKLSNTGPKLPNKIQIADVGSGSGALGITVKLELPTTKVDLLEIDALALKTSKMNVDKFTLNISVIKSDLLLESRTAYDILLCNLPYVPDGYGINEDASWEPRIALFGGSDGLNIYRKLFHQAANLQKQPLFILTESLPQQHTLLFNIAHNHGYALNRADDFIQVFSPLR